MYIYAFRQKDNRKIIYIGVDTTETQDRLNNHLKPSKRDEQPINEFIQTDHFNWLHEIIYRPKLPPGMSLKDKKKYLHEVEADLIKKHQPKYNKYLK